MVRVKVSRGYLTKVIAKVSESLAGAYAELFERLPGEAVLNIDETGHKENREKFWTWCFRAQCYTLFRIDKSRGSQVLIEVLGTEFNGVLGCDYFGAYRKSMRKFGVLVQFCMAHLIRDVKFLLTLPGREDQAYGRRVREALRELFAVIHRRETMTAADFRMALEAARAAGALGRHDPRAGHETCPQPGQTLPPAWRGVLPLHHHPGRRADQQPGRTGDSLCGHRPTDYPGNAERKRPSLVRTYLDGDCHVRSAGSRGLSVPAGLGSGSSVWCCSTLTPAVRPLTTFSPLLSLCHVRGCAITLCHPVNRNNYLNLAA